MAVVKFQDNVEAKVDLSERANYLTSFQEIKNKRDNLQQAELNSTVEVEFHDVKGEDKAEGNYRWLKDFEHRWTFKDVKTVKEFIEQKQETKKYAKRRLASFIGDNEVDADSRQKQRKVDEFMSKYFSKLEVTRPSTIENWKEKKALAKELGKIEREIDQIQEKRPRRTEEFSRDVGDISKNVKEYKENIGKARGNIEFEGNVSGSFERGKSTTTGDLDWYDEKGEKHEFIIYDNSVTHAFYRDGERETVEMSKSTAKNYYQENRLG